MTKKLDDVAKLMRKAARLIDVRGLAKNFLQDDRKRLCVRGALNFAESGNPNHVLADPRNHEAACHRLATYLLHHKRISPDYVFDVTACVSWNNHPARRKHQVVNALKAASTYEP